MTNIEINDYENAKDRGYEALARIVDCRTFQDWQAIAILIEILSKEAMAASYTKEPTGARYNEEMGKRLNAVRKIGDKEYRLAMIDKGVRSRLKDMMAHLPEVTAWRQDLPLKKQLELNHPNAVMRGWRKSLSDKNEGGSGKSHSDQGAIIKELKAEIVRLKANGGSLFSRDDTAKDIVRVVCDTLPDYKLQQVVDGCLEFMAVQGFMATEDMKKFKAAAKERALRLMQHP